MMLEPDLEPDWEPEWGPEWEPEWEPERESDPIADVDLESAIGAWFQRHTAHRVRGFVDCGTTHWQRLLDQLTGTLSALAHRADTVLLCEALSCDPAAQLSGGIGMASDGVSQSARSAELEAQYAAVRLIRAVTECAEVALDLGAWIAASGGERWDALEDIRQAAWPIFSAMEPRLFWDPRPFWTGVSAEGDVASAGTSAGGGENEGVMDAQTEDGSARSGAIQPDAVASYLWIAYVRLFLACTFDRYHALILSRGASVTATADDGGDDDGGNVGVFQPFDPTVQRRPLCRPQDLALGCGDDDPYTAGQDIAETETWTMSLLFAAIDALTDEWPRARFEPALVRFVARCLLRYAVLGHARSSPQDIARAAASGNRCAHDLDGYVTQPPGTEAEAEAGWLGVERRRYYGEGGAALRDMLSDLAVVARADTWITALSVTTEGDGVNRRHASRSPDTTWPLARRLDALLASAPPPPSQMPVQGSDALIRSPWERWDATLRGHHHAGLVKLSRGCLERIGAFLGSHEGKDAERCFVGSGVVQLLQPGEVWRFVRRWPELAATSINVINALRPRDMMLYRDRIMIPGAASLASQLAQQLPGCLIGLVDHLVWESLRHAIRMGASGDAVEALPSFLFESFHVRAEAHQLEPAISEAAWRRFEPWLPPSHLEATSRVDADADTVSRGAARWKAAMRWLAARCVTLGDLPPFPQVLLLGGRVLLWNPLAFGAFVELGPPLPPDSPTGQRAGSDDRDRSWIGRCGTRCSTVPLVDLSDAAAPVAAWLWLVGRVRQLAVLQEWLPADSDARRATRARLALYLRLGARWFGLESGDYDRPPLPSPPAIDNPSNTAERARQ